MKQITVEYQQTAKGWKFEIIKDNIKAKGEHEDYEVVKKTVKQILRTLKNNHKIVYI